MVLAHSLTLSIHSETHSGLSLGADCKTTVLM
jgi:hypothetical protein